MSRSLAPLLLLLLGVALLAGCPEPDGGGGFVEGPEDDDDSSAAVDDDDDSAQEDADGDGYPAITDCDDDDPWVHPNAPELCDELDNDCDGEVDEEPLADLNWYPDADGDGYGVEEGVVTGCIGPEGYALLPGDCAPENPAIHPGALLDGIDGDCDGRTEWLVSIQMTAVESYDLCVDDEDTVIGSSNVWEYAETHTIWLDSGLHAVGFEGHGVEWDDEDAELTGAIVEIVISNGQQWWSNSNWRYDPDPLADPETRYGWCAPGFDDTDWQPARDHGSWGVSPWGDRPENMSHTAASWIWDNVPVEHVTQYFRLEIELP